MTGLSLLLAGFFLGCGVEEAARRDRVTPRLEEALRSGPERLHVVASLVLPTDVEPDDLDAWIPRVDALKDAVLACAGVSEQQVIARFRAIPMLDLQLEPAAIGRLAACDGVEGVDLSVDSTTQAAEALPLVGVWESDGVRTTLASEYTGAGVGVAVIDNGVDLGAPELSTDGDGCDGVGTSDCRVVYAWDPRGEYDDAEPCPDGYESRLHGTNVSSIVADVAPDAAILAYHAGICAEATDEDDASARGISGLDARFSMDDALYRRATYDLKVMNLSFGSGDGWSTDSACRTDSTHYTGAIDALARAGVLVVAAAGNDGFDDTVIYPACLSTTVAVANAYDDDLGIELRSSCVDPTADPWDIVCSSNGGPLIDVAAPGCDITAGGATMCGTSQAAPVTAGVAALLAQAAPTAQPPTLRSALTASALPEVVDGSYTYPRLDLADAVEALAIPQLSLSLAGIDDDLGGDGDGLLEAGETADLLLALTNSGGSDAAVIRISPTASTTRLVPGTTTLSHDLAPAGETVAIEALPVTVAASCTSGTDALPLSLDASHLTEPQSLTLDVPVHCGDEDWDLEAVSISLDRSSADPGDRVGIDFEVGNGGSDDLPSFAWAVHLSTDATVTIDDPLWCSGTWTDGAPGLATTPVSTDCSVPGLGSGSWSVGVFLDPDDHHAESDESNNSTSSSDALTITGDGPTEVSGTITTDTTWTRANSPYVTTSSVTIADGATLTIEAGVVVKMGSADSFYVIGGLVAEGSAAQPIVWTSWRDDEYGGDTDGGGASVGVEGDWQLFTLSSTSSASMDHAVVRYGGIDSSTDYAMVRVLSDDVNISNSTFEHSEYDLVEILDASPVLSGMTIRSSSYGGARGFDIEGGAPEISSSDISDVYYGALLSSTATVLSDTRISDTNTGVYVQTGDLGSAIIDCTVTDSTTAYYLRSLGEGLIVSGNDGWGNDTNGVLLSASTSGDVTIGPYNHIPWIVNGLNVSADSSLTVEPGTVFKMASTASMSVLGSLWAVGEDDNPIVWTSLDDDRDGHVTGGTPEAGDWRYLHFQAGSTAQIWHAFIGYGGYDGSSTDYAMVQILSDDVEISASTLTESDWDVVEIDGASPTLSANAISGSRSSRMGINVHDDAWPTIDDNLIFDNYYGLFSTGSSLNAQGNYFERNTYGLRVYAESGDQTLHGNRFLYNYWALYVNNPGTGLDLRGNDGLDNTYTAVVLTGTVYGDLSLDSADNFLPLMVNGLSVGSDDSLTLEPGTTLHLAEGTNLYVAGGLTSNGTFAAPVTVTSVYDTADGSDIRGTGGSTAPNAGDWRYLYFTDTATVSMTKTDVRYGGYYGSGTDYPMVLSYGDDVDVVDSSFTDSAYHLWAVEDGAPSISSSYFSATNYVYDIGLQLTADSDGATVTNNTFENLYYGVNVSGAPATIVNNTLGSGNTYGIYAYQGASAHAVTIRGNNATAGTWPYYISYPSPLVVIEDNDAVDALYNAVTLTGSSYGALVLSPGDNEIPYLSNGLSVPDGSSLTLQPGLTLFMNNGTTLFVGGELTAAGTEALPVTITSLYDDEGTGWDVTGDAGVTAPDAGDWRYLYLYGTASVYMSNVAVRYGGYYGSGTDYPMVWSFSDDIQVQDSTFTDSAFHVWTVADGAPMLVGNHFSSTNYAYDIGLQLSSDSDGANLIGNTFENLYYGVNVSGAPATIVNNTLGSGNTYGIYAYQGASAHAVTIRGNSATAGTWPYYISYPSPLVVIEDNDAVDALYNAVTLTGNTYGDLVLSPSDNEIPYLSNGLSVPDGSSLTLQPGLTLFMNNGTTLFVGGELTAAGTEALPVTITSLYDDDGTGWDITGDAGVTAPDAGDWRYLYLYGTASVYMSNVAVRYGGYYGSGTDYPMVWSFSDDIQVYDSSFTDSAFSVWTVADGAPMLVGNSFSSTNYAYDRGVQLESDSDGATLIGNTFENLYYGVHLSGAPASIIDNTFGSGNYYGVYAYQGTSEHTVTITGNTATAGTYPYFLSSPNDHMVVEDNDASGATYNAVYLSGTVYSELTLGSDDNLVPYVASMSVDTDGRLTILPGTTLHIGNDSTLYVAGELQAAGSPAAPITITSIYDGSDGSDITGSSSAPARGDWRYIYVGATGRGVLDNTRVRYGGYYASGTDYAMVWITSDDFSVTRSNLTSSDWWCVHIEGAAAYVGNSTFSGCDSGGARLEDGDPALIGNTFTNMSYGAYATYSSPHISGNRFTGNSIGLYLSGAAEAALVEANRFQDNTTGVSAAGNAEPTLTRNSFTGTSTYGLYNSSSSVTVAAEDNWWGDASGPYNAATNPGGTGHVVNDYADFTPWLTRTPAMDTTAPTAPTVRRVTADNWGPSTTLRWSAGLSPDRSHHAIARDAGGGSLLIDGHVVGTTWTDVDAPVGVPLSYAIYAVDEAGNWSTAATSSSVTVQDPAPSRLRLTAGTGFLDLTWRASPRGTALSGYRIRYGSDPDALSETVDLGTVTSTRLEGLDSGVVIHVELTALSPTGEESDAVSGSATPG